jgi:2-polyprenyl-3-methyl-5-hydroxy-6-metoxy-1,4-benzoquinol methylase
VKTCPACEGNSAKYVEKIREYEINKCRDCGLVYSVPMKAGDESFYQHHLVYEMPTEAEALKQLESFDNARNRALWRKIPKGARILDIGCGYGAFAALSLRRGFDAWGIDFNAQQIELGRTAYGMDGRLKVGRLEALASLDLPARYDVITMFEVIEHVEDPRGLVDQVGRLLNDNGILAISCPNEARWMPAGRIFVDYPPHHLTRWSPSALKAMVQSAGFRDCKFHVDSSFRDLLWTAYVNFSASRKTARAESGEVSAPASSNFNWKRMLYDIAQVVTLPFDLVLKAFGVGTMGVRMTARKSGH